MGNPLCYIWCLMPWVQHDFTPVAKTTKSMRFKPLLKVRTTMKCKRCSIEETVVTYEWDF